MHTPAIADYAMIGNCRSAALIDRQGTLAWLCLPRFDADACFAELLGDRDNGAWRLSPSTLEKSTRQYRKDTLILETRFSNAEGACVVIDAMLMTGERPTLVRSVRGEAGTMRMKSELGIRFDYGLTRPGIEKTRSGFRLVAGPNAVTFCTPAACSIEDARISSDFTVKAGQEVSFVLDWQRSFAPRTELKLNVSDALTETENFWRAWVARCKYKGPDRDAVVRSLITLKALTYTPTGAITAAATTSLPEHIGGVRNWDYRFCWLRDATFTLYALRQAGYLDEAQAWRHWLMRAAAGEPSATQTLYSLTGRRRLTEEELPWLSGFADSKPVRIGNAAAKQFQLDVLGEVINTLFLSRQMGIDGDESWPLEEQLIAHVAKVWTEPDEGIWEVRGPRQHFTHSKVLAWVGIDRGIQTMEKLGKSVPAQLRALRAHMHEEICAQAFNKTINAFTQAYGSQELDASVLMMPLLGFISGDDPRWLGTMRAIEKTLLVDGFVKRYDTQNVRDGLPPGEGMFLPCSFWFADNLYLLGRKKEAREMFDRLLSVRNDVGLLAEEFDPVARTLIGNFPQAFSHVGLVNTAFNLSSEVEGPVDHHLKSHSARS